MLDTQNCLQNHIKNAKATNFFYNQPSTLPEEALAKFYFSRTFGLTVFHPGGLLGRQRKNFNNSRTSAGIKLIFGDIS